MGDLATTRLLQGAELWARPLPGGAEPTPSDGDGSVPSRGLDTSEPGPAFPDPDFIAGWEDGTPFCATICFTDVGLAFCGRCPTAVVARTIRTGRPASGRCPAGVRLLAFPVPLGQFGMVGLLRTAPPDPQLASRVAGHVRVSPAALRRAARAAHPADGRATLAAARVLRSPDGLRTWLVAQRVQSADRHRAAEAARAQMIATSHEVHELYRRSKRQHANLERSQRALDRLARETLRAKDEERARIAHQIHDTAAQSMVSAFRFLEAATASASALPSPTKAHLAAAGERIQASIKEVRVALNQLVPAGLEELGLAGALDARLRVLAAGTGTECRLVGSMPRLDGWVEQALYGMIGEAAGNAIRHGHASALRIDLREERGRAVVLIRDNGVGFDPLRLTSRSNDSGLGLQGINRQTSWLGGKASVKSQIGRGTTVRISIPLDRHRAAQVGKTVGGDGQATAPAEARTPPRESDHTPGPASAPAEHR